MSDQQLNVADSLTTQSSGSLRTDLESVRKRLENAHNYLSVVSWKDMSVQSLDKAVTEILDAVNTIVSRMEEKGLWT